MLSAVAGGLQELYISTYYLIIILYMHGTSVHTEVFSIHVPHFMSASKDYTKKKKKKTVKNAILNSEHLLHVGSWLERIISRTNLN